MADESLNCIFCKILNDEVAASLVHSDEEVIVINDINPKAPIHLLIIPRKHIASVEEMKREDIYLMGHMIWVAKLMADEHRIDTKGYKLVINTGKDGGQMVPHVHLHLLGGTKLGGLV